MEAKAKRAAKFFNEDIVRKKDDPSTVAVVLRCWHDSEDLPVSPQAQAEDPLLRPLKRGEVGISHLGKNDRQIVKESDYVLLDRTFQVGDICKLSFDSVVSGVVIQADVSVKLEHAITRTPIAGWVSCDELHNWTEVYIGDYVIVDDWVGEIEEIFDETTAQLRNGDLFRFAELGSRFRVGDRGMDLGLPSLNSLFQGITGSPEVILQIKPTVVAVTWLAINQTLERDDAQKRQRPKRFWSGVDMSQLTFVRPRSDCLSRVGERVAFKNPSVAAYHGVKPSRHGRDNRPPGVLEIDTMIIRETQTKVTVMWQDGRTQAISATELIPYVNVDEYDCWPGDFVVWQNEDEKRVAVVQKALAEQRTAEVLWYPLSSEQTSPTTVSVLELDPHGSSAASQGTAQETFGVRRGDYVFIHKEGTVNGSELPRVPRIGEVEPWVREGGTGANAWRTEMARIGMSIVDPPQGSDSPMEGTVRREADPSIDWFGEVTNLLLTGKAEVTLPNRRTVQIPLERLTLLQDTIGDFVDMWGDDLSDGVGGMEGDEILYDSVWGDSVMDPSEMENQSDDSWETYEGEGDVKDAWEDMDVDDDVPPLIPIQPTKEPEGVTSIAPIIDPGTPLPAPRPILVDESQSSTPRPTESSSSTPIPSTSAMPVASGSLSTDDDPDSPWQRFQVLSSAPADHAYYNTKSSLEQPSKGFHPRMAKEYRALTSSLPDTILVRAYEDRADLLRCLIIGPENTPYEDAPFVIDWFLDSTFPQTPPQAHFLSWTNGNGRVNPNLYEEGKVCLSILGTWAGDQNESWNPLRSSLLQAFVSIQGLVLVKEPWFCEPAFEKLRGTEEGIVNSRLYNEKAYFLSRGFVRRALETPVGSLEAEIEWLYYKRGKLEKVIRDSTALIEKSERSPPSDDADDGDGDENNDRAVKRLTPGAALPLKRTLARLQTLLDAYNQKASIPGGSS